MSKQVFTKLATRERHITEEVRRHQFFSRLDDITDDQLREYLLQRMFTSKAFVAWYRAALEKVRHSNAKSLIGSMLADEQPAGRTTHFQDLHADLGAIGIRPSTFSAVSPTDRTSEIIERMFDLLGSITGHSGKDIYTLELLRVAGELLVSLEYGLLLPQLEMRFGLTVANSVFYYPHAIHGDPKTGSHALAFESVLKLLVVDQMGLGTACLAADHGKLLRVDFLDQFV